VHLLLPPSEAKVTGGRGRPLRHRPAPDAALGATRLEVATALGRLVAGAPEVAARALLLPAGVAAEALALDAAVLDSPTVPALRRYAGVVYDGLDYARMDAGQQRIAGRSILIFSGLLGVVRGTEAVPAYRVPAKATLPGLGVVATHWRPVLAEYLPTHLRSGLVVDLRSSDYAAMWRPDRRVAERVVTVRVLSPAPRGGYAVISYASKLAKGHLAAALIRRQAGGGPVERPADVAAAWAESGGAGCEPSGSHGLDLYTG
jgi:uncharacterized protein